MLIHEAMISIMIFYQLSLKFQLVDPPSEPHYLQNFSKLLQVTLDIKIIGFVLLFSELICMTFSHKLPLHETNNLELSVCNEY